MTNYIISLLFFCVSVSFLYSLGFTLTKSVSEFSKNFILGFIFYFSTVSVFLILIQLFKLPWIFALYSVVTIVIILSVYIIVAFIKNKLCITKKDFISIVKNNYFSIFCVFLLYCIYLLQFDLIWINNHLDDGYYLTKVATLPYLENPYITNYSTGLLNISNGFDSYLLSSYETHASVYRYLLGIDPVVFCRFFMNIFNYFLAVCTVDWFAAELNKRMAYRISKSMIQFCSMVLLIFAFEYTTLARTGLLMVQDSWQFSSAMWYGSSIPRVMGLLWLIVPFINREKIQLKDFVYVTICSFVLIACSSIALPIIVIGGISYLVAFSVTANQKNIRIFTVIILILVILSGWILPDSPQRSAVIKSFMSQDLKSILFVGSILVTAISVIIFKNRFINRTIITIITCFILMFVPEINDFFEKLSIYDFVYARAQTCFIYTFIIFSFILFIFIFNYLLKNNLKFIIVFSLCLLCSLSILSVIPVYGNPMNIYKIMLNNSYLMPNSTIDLSKQLQSIAEIYNMDLNVLTPEWASVENHRHSLSVMIRTYAPNVNSISAIGRFGVTEGNAFSSYTSDDTGIYNSFCEVQNTQTIDAFKQLLNEYPINCLVFTGDFFNEYSTEFGYTFEKKVDNYYIYVKNNS